MHAYVRYQTTTNREYARSVECRIIHRARAMVLTRSMAAKLTMAARTPLALQHDFAVEIAGRVAASSPQPMDDVRSLRASCRAMHAACGERAVGRRVALEREVAGMRWSENERYHAVVDHLAGAGNPEACFLTGLAHVFARREARAAGAELLGRAAASGHKAAAYVLSLCKAGEARGIAMQYIREVEGEAAAAAGDTDDKGCNRTKRTNRECLRYRARAAEAVREVTWNVAWPPAPVPVLPPEDGHRCTAAGCGVPEGWRNDAVFCSDDCRIRHEHAEFFR